MAGKKVLIIDDDEKLCTMLTLSLKAHGIKAISVTESTEAIDSIRKEKPDVILLDIMMPEVDGFSVLEKIKCDASLKDIRVVILSALSGAPIMRRTEELGAYDYVEKPFHMERLVEMIKSIIDSCDEVSSIEGNRTMRRAGLFP